MTSLLLRRRRSIITPLSVQGCRLWLRADSFVNLSSGDAPQNWYDQSANGTTVGRTPVAERPQYITNVLAGKPVMRGDGSNDIMLSNSATVPFTTDWTLWGVWSNRSTGTNRQVSLYVGTSAINGYGCALSANSGKKGFLFGGVAWFDSTVAESTGFEVWVLQRRSSTTRLWVNGGAPIISTGVSPVQPSSSILTFTSGSTNPFTDCDIAECGVHSGGQSLTTTNVIGRYLASRWGLTWTTATDS